jgi:hypothetical protein
MASIPISLCKSREDLLIYKTHDHMSLLKHALVLGNQAIIDYVLELPEDTLKLVIEDDGPETLLHIAARNQY